jgi:hypothetical protein
MPDNPFFEKARELAEADFPVEQHSDDDATPDEATTAEEPEEPEEPVGSEPAPESSGPSSGGAAPSARG